MTWIEFERKYNNLLNEDDLEDNEVKVYFDFPLNGNVEKYEIAKVTKDGIMIKNPTCARPMGH